MNCLGKLILIKLARFISVNHIENFLKSNQTTVSFYYHLWSKLFNQNRLIFWHCFWSLYYNSLFNKVSLTLGSNHFTNFFFIIFYKIILSRRSTMHLSICCIIFRCAIRLLIKIRCCCQRVICTSLSRSLDRFIFMSRFVFISLTSRLGFICRPSFIKLFVWISISFYIPRVIYNNDKITVIINTTGNISIVLGKFLKTDSTVSFFSLDYI